MPAPLTILLIDTDADAARELSELLLDQPGPPRLLLAQQVSAAMPLLTTETIDWLFIRINQWDDYQQVAASAKHRPTRVVFLSGRAEKCTDQLPTLLDAHLQPPYRASYLRKVWNRLSDPEVQPQPFDFFFIKAQARYVPVRYADLHQVRRYKGQLQLQTRQGDYTINGSLSAFQARLPIPLTRVHRGWLVNESYEP